MIVNNNGTIISMREKLLEFEKRKGVDSSNSVQNQSSISKNKDVRAEPKNIADIIAIKKENILASSAVIRQEEDAAKLLNELKDSFSNNVKNSLDAHKKADTDRIMSYYPFD